MAKEIAKYGIDAASVFLGGVVGYYHAQGVDLSEVAVYGAVLVPVGVQGIRNASVYGFAGGLVGGIGGTVAESILGSSYIENTDVINAGAITGAVAGGITGFAAGAVLGGLETAIGYGLGYAAGSLQKML